MAGGRVPVATAEKATLAAAGPRSGTQFCLHPSGTDRSFRTRLGSIDPHKRSGTVPVVTPLLLWNRAPHWWHGDHSSRRSVQPTPWGARLLVLRRSDSHREPGPPERTSRGRSLFPVCWGAGRPQTRDPAPYPRRSGRLAAVAPSAVPSRLQLLPMKVTCAEYGRLVDHGVIVERCERHLRCCCGALPLREPQEPPA